MEGVSSIKICFCLNCEKDKVTVLQRVGDIIHKIKSQDQIKSNQLVQLGNVRNGFPISRAKRASIPDRIGMYKCWFLEKGKTGVPGEKLLGAEKRAINKLDLHDNAGFWNRTPGHMGGR